MVHLFFIKSSLHAIEIQSDSRWKMVDVDVDIDIGVSRSRRASEGYADAY